MKKRTVCILLAALMLFSLVLVSCGEVSSDDAIDETNEIASESTITLSMFVVCEKPVSEKTAEEVNEAFNRITKSTFKTRVVLHFLTYDEYYSTIEGKIQSNADRQALAEQHEKDFRIAKKEAAAESIATDKLWEDSWYAAHPEYVDFRETEELTGEDTTAEETILVTVAGAEDYTISEIKYPDEKDYQLDIIWIDSYDRYTDYIEKDWLTRIDDELNGGSKKLKEYVSPALLAWTKWSSKGTYAIPNNSAVGDYTYMLLNKSLVEKYNYDPDKITGISSDDCRSFLEDVSKYEPDYAPILGEIPVTNTVYWYYDVDANRVIHDKFNLMGNSYAIGRTLDPAISTNSPTGCSNIMSVTAYTDQLRTIRQYKDLGYVRDEGSTDKYAVKFVKGGAELNKVYGDEYYLNILEYPRVEEDDIFSSMFAVTTFTRSVNRSMQIVTYLNTNRDLRNVLQYGVEGVHYTLDLDGVAHRLSDDYVMNIRNTGNLFVCAPEEGMDPEIWKFGKQQNLDIKAGLLNCFRVPVNYLVLDPEAKEQSLLDTNQIKAINAASDQLLERLNAAGSLEELEAVIASAQTLQSSAVRNQVSSRNAGSLYYIYYEWVQDTGLYIPTDD
ncbi:MAG: hypothetical protein ILO42_04445 [Clostridia bacterium]|nr:hypothetical protein [Clostridia bacterium]